MTKSACFFQKACVKIQKACGFSEKRVKNLKSACFFQKARVKNQKARENRQKRLRIAKSSWENQKACGFSRSAAIFDARRCPTLFL